MGNTNTEWTDGEPGAGQEHGLTRREFLEETAGATLLGVSAVLADSHRQEKKLLTQEELAALLPGRVEWLTIEEIERHGRHCVDGRCRSATGEAGGAGGDLALLVTLAATYEDEARRELDDATIRQMLREYPGTFYWHTDDHAEEHLAEAILADPLLQKFAKDKEQAKQLIARGIDPREAEARSRLLDLVTHAENQGCGHMKHMFQDPKKYEIGRGDLGRSFLRGAFEEMWGGNKRFVREELSGHHLEGAIVTAEVGTGIRDAESRLPVLKPCDAKGEQQFFIHHPQYTAYRMDKLADALRKHLAGVRKGDLVSHALRKESAQLAETAHRLAPKGSAHFRVRYARERDKEPAVTVIGRVE